ncbi:hypothetical protein [Haloarcula amylovorans]|uniref:hypothetical protein n=1 Tax=Haloarcula amylovorans TaxID=2562280 RepID=UPI0010767641|nr:hypothetical protein [Halomicroarcula amylolytica]
MSAQTPADEYELVDNYSPETIDADLEVGARGQCEKCDTELIESPSEASGRLTCPSCKIVIGLAVMYPGFNGEGKPGDAADWPITGNLSDGDEDTDKTWTYEYAIRGSHNGNDLVQNEAEAQFGPPPEACCVECGAQFTFAAKATVVSEREVAE